MNGSYANGAPQAVMNGNGVLKDTHTNGHTTRLQSKHVTVVEPPTTNGSTANGTTTTHTTRRIPMHDRKLSNPLAPPFLVSAPGKTIVYGEHAVVHGKAAIAAAISLRSYMLVTTLSKSKRTVSLKFSDIGLDHTWNITELPWKTFSHPDKKKRYYDMVTSLDEELVAAMQPHIANVSPEASPEARKIHMSAASSFLYLFLSLGSESSPACIYALRSAIPIAAGLGSSASISVCISAALLIQSRALSGPHPDQMGHEAEEQLERINRWAFVGELAIHGTPSGVDNTVATNGRAVLFQRKDYTKPPMVKVLRDFPELPLLLVNTLQPKSTSAEVAKVALLKERHPAVADSILNGIDAITRSVHDCISSDDFDALFTTSAPVVFDFHGYPSLVHQLTYRRTNHDSLHVRGFQEKGTTTTPFDMAMLNDIDRFRLVLDVLHRVPGLADEHPELVAEFEAKREEARAYAYEHGEDLPEVVEWEFGR